ncbi:hypothetical protein G6M89_02030 [Natronolimnobius sp. AArcel1]|uniref:hypothetical protein n=1 Tax=Natronolimnobius sp. AArcel1 TaxID=1679093 RepID=UPI0013ED2F07|nr:hypothetical protein [Natronolimnobius sp. AArcel1]NGM67798.1 hypothetical protein [Natronolimnobius sp. AArcel1]
MKSYLTRRDLPFGRFHRTYHSGLVLPGSWDLYTAPIESEPIYRAYKRRFNDGVPWERTEYGKRIFREYERGRSKKGYDTKDAYFESREQLYRTLESEGYDPSHGPITINIGRDGSLIANNGMRHRTAICALLGLESIPVEVIVRHDSWQEVRAEIRTADAVDDLSKRAQAHLDHPDVAEYAIERS